jgi:hypothetical protein
LLQAGLTSRDRYTENQILARAEYSLETPPAASRHHVVCNLPTCAQTINPKKIKKMTELDTLKEFLSYPLNSAEEIMERFASLPNAEWRKGSGEQQQFVFVSGTRKDAATLVAHADTVFDYAEHTFAEEDGIIKSTTSGCGLGADDRAGCAILWLLKDSGHNLLITDGEEHGQIGAKWLVNSNTDIAEISHNSSFMVQFDRRNGSDYKFYDIPVSKEFENYIRQETGYANAGRSSFTDIVTLCKNADSCCGVNLSVGYYDEHSSYETLNIEEWNNTLEIAKRMLKKQLKRFPLTD